MATPARRRAWNFGRFAEGLCVWVLRLHGYRILARDYRTAVGEIDIVARRWNTLAVVEVKARRDLAKAAESLTRRQRRRIARAAAAFLMSHPRHAGLAVRFDLMLVRPWRPPTHLKGAWREGE
jgi:putative endonuclease